MAKKQFIITPAGVAVFPHLEEPDTYKGQTKYKTKLEVSGADAKAFLAKLKAETADYKFATKKPKLPISEGKEEGTFLISASSQYAPLVFDSQNKQLPEGSKVGGGSQIRLLCELYNYEDGVSLRLKQVQVIDLKSRGVGTSGFDAIEDGYTADDDGEVSGFDGGGDDSEAMGGLSI